MLINGTFSNSEEATSGVPQSLTLGPELTSIFINEMDKEVQGMLCRFVDDTKMGGITNILEGRNKIKKDLDTVEYWAEKTTQNEI